LDSYDEEIVRDLDVNPAMSPVCVVVATAAKDKTAVLRMATLAISQLSVQIGSMTITRVDYPISVVKVASISGSINLFAGAGDRLLFFRHVGGSLQLSAQMAGVGVSIGQMLVTTTGAGDFSRVYVGDSARSVKLAQYMDDTKQLQIVCEEGCMRSVTALASYSLTGACGGDTLGNLFVVDYAQVSPTAFDRVVFRAGRRLPAKMNFHVGEVISGVSFTSDIFDCLWYNTICGAMGGIIVAPAKPDVDWLGEHTKRLRLLRAVEMEVSHMFAELTKCDHLKFRNRYFPAANVVDFDMIELFSGLNEERKERIAKKLAEVYKNQPAMKAFENLTVAGIEFEIARYLIYFLDWQKKPKTGAS
jgi:hypothetical protein